MLKEIAKAMAFRALSIIIALTLLSVYCAVRDANANRKNKKERDAKANAAVNQVQDLMSQLTAKIEAVLPRFQESSPIEQLDIKTELRTECLANAKTIENGSVRDIYLTSVEQMLDRAFAAKA